MNKHLKTTLLLSACCAISVSCVKKTSIANPDLPVYTNDVTTLAGDGVGGFKDGVAATAQFDSPCGIATDVLGNLYIADAGNNRIRKITPDGMISTLAGDGTIGARNGIGAAAQFNGPHAIAVDTWGNIYVADSSNNLIRQVTPDGIVNTIAGDGSAGYNDGDARTAEFNAPSGIAINVSGDLYVSDSNNRRIRKISPRGVVSTVTDTLFDAPQHLDFDAAGNLFVVEGGKGLIRKISPAGIVSTLAGKAPGGFADGTGNEARFFFPEGIAIDAYGNIYVGDLGNNRIRKITPEGIVSTVAGSQQGYANGPGNSARFFAPSDLAIDRAGNIYICDLGNYRIRKMTIK